MKKTIYILTILTSVALLSCCGGKDPEPEFGTVKIKFSNKVKDELIDLSGSKFTATNGDTFSINAFKYLISNISLSKSGSKKYTQSNSYFIVNEYNSDSKTITLDSVPIGEYDQINFGIGVDAAHDNGTASEGDLSTNNGLFWASWQSYIYVRFDGIYHNNSEEYLAFHIGGSNNYIEKTLSLPTNVSIENESTSNILIDCSVEEMFGDPYTIDLSKIQNVANASTTMDSVAVNYKNMFSVTKVEN